jgi:short-subunit dehydrogenase
MVLRRHGRILNVASTAAFQPGPSMAVYYASKSYVLSFSQAVNDELRGSGVSVTTLCPGPTRTNFENLSADFAGSNLMKMGLFVPVEEVAGAAWRGLMSGAPVVVPGFKNKLVVLSTRFAPRGLLVAISRWVLKKD